MLNRAVAGKLTENDRPRTFELRYQPAVNVFVTQRVQQVRVRVHLEEVESKGIVVPCPEVPQPCRRQCGPGG